MDSTDAIVDQRALSDRRMFSWQTVFFGFLKSRRLDSRRGDETEVIFLDKHHPWLFFLSVGVMLMSCIDAFLTLQLLDRGMVEANPVMAAMLGQSTQAFAAGKMLMTAIGILAIVFAAKARFMNRIRTGLFLTLFFSLYACLICYEFVFLIRTM